MTVTHELVHALQDQYVNLDSLQFLRGNDRKMAAQAVFEGEALYEQFAANGVELNVPGGWNRVRAMMRKSQTAMPIFAAAPPLIRETLLFPYLDGAEFIKTYKARRGHAVPFADMPQSTEQILHPETAYFGTRDAPTPVSFAPFTSARTRAGMTPVFDDDLGEFETSILAFGLPADSAPRQLAEGWDGDHYLLFATPQGNALAWASVWDSPAQAHRVQAALERRIAERNARQNAGENARDAAARRSRTLTAGTVDGRPVLLYLDLPEGVDRSVISLSSIRLGPQ
jgi:hypothetical protein